MTPAVVMLWFAAGGGVEVVSGSVATWSSHVRTETFVSVLNSALIHRSAVGWTDLRPSRPPSAYSALDWDGTVGVATVCVSGVGGGGVAGGGGGMCGVVCDNDSVVGGGGVVASVVVVPCVVLGLRLSWVVGGSVDGGGDTVADGGGSDTGGGDAVVCGGWWG